jgi:ATP-dependent Clp protease protease subunit
MTRSQAHGSATDTWPWPPEIPRRPDQPPYPPYRPPGTPHEPAPASPPPAPILPTWEEPDPGWIERHVLERLLDQRVVLVTGRLDDPAASRASSQLLLLDRTDHTRPIELHLSCRDSELEPSLALAAGLDLVRSRVHAVVTGILSGPAIAALCAASERQAHRHATFVLRLPQTSTQETATSVATQAEEHERAVAQVVERIATVTGREAEHVDADLRSGLVMDAAEARTYGLVGTVLEG